MKTAWATVAFLSFALSAESQVLFEQRFAQTPLPQASNNVQLVADNLDYPYHEEQGQSILLRDETAGVCYPLPQTVTGQKTLYLSFCLQSRNTTNKDKFAGLILYKNGQEVFGLGNDYTTENFSWWRSDGKGEPIGEVPVAVDSFVHRIVMRVDFDPAGPEKIRIWLDPVTPRTEDRQPDRIVTEVEQELSFDELRLRCGNRDCDWGFDEICIGSDWASVNPADEEPGSYLEEILRNARPAAASEMIGEGIARFRRTAESQSAELPSFVLEKPRPKTGPLVAAWKLLPCFAELGGERHVVLDLPVQTDLYGTGEVTGSLLRNGSRTVLFNKDNYGYNKPDQLYQSHPWVLGLREDGTAFGVIFDTPWKAALDLRAGILFSVPADAPDFPVIIIEAASPQAVLQKLASLTGTMPMPPRWALGYQQCRYSYYPDARARWIADTFRARQIPCDVIWFDIDYMDGFRIFTFDPNHYPDPAATNDYLHATGFKSVWMIDPGVKYDPGYFVYDSGTAADVWVQTAAGTPYIGPVWPGDCVFPDFTMPAARRWWAALYKPFLSAGIDGIWNDMNEPAVFREESGWTMPLDNRHRGGDDLPPGPHIQYHNVYGMLMVRATRQGIVAARPDKRPFVLSRANFLGGHRYAATWTGDNAATWQHLKWSVPMSLNLSLSGQPFNGPDIGGFIGDATPNLWAHWIAVGAFYPFSRAHTSTDTSDQEPWCFGPATEQAARTALQRRYRLMPYLYTVFSESHRTGLPVMRPVFFADPADLSLRMEDQAFLLGSDVMITPQWAADPRLPQGIWRPVSIVDEAAEADGFQCSVKIRGGAIVPLGPVIQTTEQITPDLPLTLLVVLDEQGRAAGTLYEDDGDGDGFQSGQFCLSAFAARRQPDGSVLVRCTGQEGKLARSKRLAAVTLIDADGVRHGFGDLNCAVKILPE